MEFFFILMLRMLPGFSQLDGVHGLVVLLLLPWDSGAVYSSSVLLGRRSRNFLGTGILIRTSSKLDQHPSDSHVLKFPTFPTEGL